MWYIRDWEFEDVIVNIKDFPNVPLIRQHDYPMNGPPRAKALEPFILHNIEADHPTMKKIKRSWQAIIRRGKELGKRNVIAREPYTYWVRERVQIVKLPFAFDPSIYLLVPELKPILHEDVEKPNSWIKELELENTNLRIKLGQVSMENANMKDSQ